MVYEDWGKGRGNGGGVNVREGFRAGRGPHQQRKKEWQNKQSVLKKGNLNPQLEGFKN